MDEYSFVLTLYIDVEKNGDFSVQSEEALTGECVDLGKFKYGQNNDEFKKAITDEILSWVSLRIDEMNEEG